jgi:colanic acid biosynthesis glycosyl transferase WcaI
MIFVSADQDSEIYKVINQNKIGICSTFGDIDQMEYLLNEYLQNKGQFEILKSNAFTFVKQFDREAVMRGLFNKINDCIFKEAAVEKLEEIKISDYSRDKVYN